MRYKPGGERVWNQDRAGVRFNLHVLSELLAKPLKACMFYIITVHHCQSFNGVKMLTFSKYKIKIVK